MLPYILIHILLVFALQTTSNALDNGVGLVPTMGINTWNSLRCTSKLNAINLMHIADNLVASGLSDLGYKILSIDDCWSMPSRDPRTGKLRADPQSFPKGVADVANYVRALNLSLGMYSDRGSYTCAGRPGSGGHEKIDAEYFAIDVGISLLKYDSCYASSDHKIAFQAYGAMRDALNKTGKHINIQVCGWNAWYAPHGNDLGNSWRIAADSDDWIHIYRAIRTNENLSKYAGPGHFNDPDMLVGSGKDAAISITPKQSRTQFNMWAVMAAPLMIGASLTDMTDWDFETYSNVDVIAIDQDILGIQGIPVYNDCPNEPFLPLEQASPTTYPFHLTPWSWPISLVSHIVAIICFIVGILFILTCIIECWCRHSLKILKKSERADAYDSTSMMLATKPGKPETDQSVDFLTEEDKMLLHNQSSANKRCVTLCPCQLSSKCCCWRVTSIIFVCVGGCLSVFAVWLSIILSWEVPDCSQVWAKPLISKSGSRISMAMVMVNFAKVPRLITCDEACWIDAGFSTNLSRKIIFKDLWKSNMTSCTLKSLRSGIECHVGSDGDSVILMLEEIE
jgi:hypothetical protein